MKYESKQAEADANWNEMKKSRPALAKVSS